MSWEPRSMDGARVWEKNENRHIFRHQKVWRLGNAKEWKDKDGNINGTLAIHWYSGKGSNTRIPPVGGAWARDDDADKDGDTGMRMAAIRDGECKKEEGPSSLKGP